MVLEKTEYEELFKDNVTNQKKIAKMFIENRKMKKQLIQTT